MRVRVGIWLQLAVTGLLSCYGIPALAEGPSATCFTPYLAHLPLELDEHAPYVEALARLLRKEIARDKLLEIQQQAAVEQPVVADAEKVTSISGRRMITKTIPGVTGDILWVQYGSDRADQAPVLSLQGGKLSKNHYVGSIKVSNLLKGSGYLWNDPGNLVFNGHTDFHFFQAAPAANFGVTGTAGVLVRLSGDDTKGIATGAAQPRLGLGFERKKITSTDTAPAVGVHLVGGPEIGRNRGIATVGGATRVNLDIKF